VNYDIILTKALNPTLLNSLSKIDAVRTLV